MFIVFDPTSTGAAFAPRFAHTPDV